MSMQGNVMQMRELKDGLAIPPMATSSLRRAAITSCSPG